MSRRKRRYSSACLRPSTSTSERNADSATWATPLAAGRQDATLVMFVEVKPVMGHGVIAAFSPGKFVVSAFRGLLHQMVKFLFRNLPTRWQINVANPERCGQHLRGCAGFRRIEFKSGVCA